MLKDKWTQQINEQKHGNIDSDTTGETNLIDSEPTLFQASLFWQRETNINRATYDLSICMRFNIHIHVVNKVKKKNIL